MKKFGMTLIAMAILTVGFSDEVSALAEFKKAFAEKYTDKEANEEFHTTVRKAGCWVCHVKGKDKDVRNSYGDALAELIEGDANERKKEVKDKEKEEKDAVKAKILEELDAAMDAVAEKENSDGVKYGDLIKDHKLPVPLPPKDKDDE